MVAGFWFAWYRDAMTELKATLMRLHTVDGTTHRTKEAIYPAEYSDGVVGMLNKFRNFSDLTYISVSMPDDQERNFNPANVVWTEVITRNGDDEDTVNITAEELEAAGIYRNRTA